MYGEVVNARGPSWTGLGAPELPRIAALVKFRRDHAAALATDPAVAAHVTSEIAAIEELRRVAGVSDQSTQQVYVDSRRTLYSRIGDLFSWLLVIFTAAGLLALWDRKPSDHASCYTIVSPLRTSADLPRLHHSGCEFCFFPDGFPMRTLKLLGAMLGFVQVVSASTVWIDTDVSIGSPIREVDDAYALVLALHSPEIRIAGLSTTYGNAPLGHTTRVAQDIARRFGARADLSVARVYSGARSAAELGRPTEASHGLAAALTKDRLIYIALGPLTNLATFLRLHPNLAARIDRVILLGGQAPGTSLALRPDGSFRIHDANVFKDPAATAAVVRSSIPLTAIPVSTASKLLLNAADLRALEKGGEAGNYLSRRSRIWLWFYANVVRTKGGAVFDTLAIIAATKPGLLTIEEQYAGMDDKGNLRVTAQRRKGARPIRYCTGFAPGTKRFVIQRIMTRRSRD